MSSIAERRAATLEEVDRACDRAGRRRSEVLLVAVSKFHPVSAVAEAAAAGQMDFGENYVQEALAKRLGLPAEPGFSALRWHMIGHVQSRKAADVAGNFALAHTLDSIKLADAFEKRLAALDAVQPALLEINIGGEPQKSGAPAGGAKALAAHILENCPHLLLRGLMCMAPVFDAGEKARPHFAKLRRLRDNLERDLGAKLPELSMGMSGDFEAAIEEGATIVRIGTKIFGPRPKKTAA